MLLYQNRNTSQQVPSHFANILGTANCSQRNAGSCSSEKGSFFQPVVGSYSLWYKNRWFFALNQQIGQTYMRNVNTFGIFSMNMGC